MDNPQVCNGEAGFKMFWDEEEEEETPLSLTMEQAQLSGQMLPFLS